MTDRIREALEAKPEVLWDLLVSLKKHPPKIAGMWAPARMGTRFSISRANTNGHDLVEITRDEPDHGPWQFKFNSPKFRGAGQSEFDKLITATAALSFEDLRNQIDDILEAHGWILIDTKFPGTSFCPWAAVPDATRPGTEHRPYWTQGDDIEGLNPPWVEPREPDEDDDKHKAQHKAQWVVPTTTGDIVGTTYNLNSAKRHVDDTLVSLGFNLADPNSHNLVQMKREHDRWVAKNAQNRKRDKMKVVKMSDGSTMLVGDEWVEHTSPVTGKLQLQRVKKTKKHG